MTTPVQPLVQTKKQSQSIQPVAAAASTSAIDEVFFDLGAGDTPNSNEDEDDLISPLESLF